MSHPEKQDQVSAMRLGRTPSRSGAHAAGEISRVLRSSLESMLSRQDPEGFWVGELEADSSLEADAILLDHFLRTVNPERIGKLAASIREEQMAEGGWRLYPGGPANVNVTIKAYFGLRLAGLPDSDPALQKARKTVLELGGVEAANSFTRICLCLFDRCEWGGAPALPPELPLLPSFACISSG